MPLSKQSALHRKRGFRLGRAAPLAILPPVADPTPTPTPTSIPTPAAKDTKTPPKAATPATTTITDDHGLIPGILSSILSPVLGTSTTSSSISTTSVSATTSSTTTSSLPTTSSVPTTTSTTPRVVVHTTQVSSLTSTQFQTPSATAQTSGGISAATVIGGIGGALAATLLLTVIIAFILRRWRRKKAAEDAFDASHFRHSAVLLDENDDNTHGRPRPPTMIERRNASSPPAAYPYSDEPPFEYTQSFAQHGANQDQYRAVSPQPPFFATGTQFGDNGGAPAMHYGPHPYATNYGQGDPFTGHSGPGQGAPPIPGIHGPGAYAPYGVDSRYPQSQRYPHPQQYQNPQPQQQLQREESVSSRLPNPFSSIPVSGRLGPTEGSVPESLSTSSSSTPPPVSSNPGTASFVTRQSHEVPPAYTNSGGYTEVQRDVKASPSSNVANHSSDTAAPETDRDTTKAVGTTTTTTMTESNGRVPEPRRPHTVYDDDDVYGGM